MKDFRTLLLFLIALVNSGCAFNSVRPLPEGGLASRAHAVIIYGIKIESPWRYPALPVSLAEYDIAKQNITGSCWRYNRTDANVPLVQGQVRYVAFDAPDGHYAYSPFHVARLAGEFLAFEAPANQAVYIGTFTYQEGKQVQLTRRLDEQVKRDINAALPGLTQDISLSKATIARPPHIFICMP